MMKTKILITAGLLIPNGFILINTSFAQDDIYYTPSKNVAVNTTAPAKEMKDTAGMTDYEKYRVMREKETLNDPKSLSDTTLSQEEMARKKGMERYGRGNSEFDSTSSVNENQSYSQEPSENSQQDNTVVNNYYYDSDYDYPNRFRWYHNFYFDSYYDPFFYDYYYPYNDWYWGSGFSWGWPSWRFNFGWYSPGYYWYDPYYYRPYYWCYPNYYGYWDGSYNNYNNYNRGYISSGARRGMGGYRLPSETRCTALYGNSPIIAEKAYERRVASGRTITPVTENGATYDDARRKAWQTYQTKNVNQSITSNRREQNFYDRYKSIQTTRPETTGTRRNVRKNNSEYTPSYNTTPRTSTKPLYNDNDNYRRTSTPKYNDDNNKSYSTPSYNGSGSDNSKNRRSNDYSSPAPRNNTGSGYSGNERRSSYSPSSNSGSSHSSSGSYRSSGGSTSKSGSSSHSGGSSSGGRRR